MNYLKRLQSGSRTQINVEQLPIDVSDEYLEEQKREREWYKTMREATAKVPVLEEEIRRLKKERKEWHSQKTNLEQDHAMFVMQNKNLQTKAHEAERRWMELKKLSERLESDNSDIRKRLQEEEIQVKELRLRFGFDLSRVSTSMPRKRSTSTPMATAPDPNSSESFMRRVQMAKRRLSINVNEKFGGRAKAPEKVVSITLLNERTESYQQTVQALQQELTELEEKHNGLVVAFKESKILNEGLKQSNEDMEQQVNDLRGELRAQVSPRRSGPIAEVESVKETYDQRTRNLEHTNEELQSALTGIEVQRTEIVQEKSVANTEMDQRRQSRGSIENDLATSRSTVKSHRSDLEKANKTIKRLNAEIVEMRQRLGDMQIREKNSVSHMKDLENRLELTQGELQTMKGLVSRFEKGQHLQVCEDDNKDSQETLESNV